MKGSGAGIFIALLLWSSTVAAAGDPFANRTTAEALRSTLARPAEKLAKAHALRGLFRQNRHLREIPKPLLATGDFTFARDIGFFWHTRQPFDSTLMFNDTGMVQMDAGAPPQHPPADQQPAARLIGQLFTALFTLDIARLDEEFELFESVEGERWTLGLKPRADAIAAIVRQVTVSGSGDVERVELLDARGDRTVIELSRIEYSSVPLPAEVLQPPTPRSR